MNSGSKIYNAVPTVLKKVSFPQNVGSNIGCSCFTVGRLHGHSPPLKASPSTGFTRASFLLSGCQCVVAVALESVDFRSKAIRLNDDVLMRTELMI
jgi:hypothetical protein